MAKKITFLKENLCIDKCFIDVLYIFSSVLKKITKLNAPRFEMDFVLNCAMCSDDFTCVRERIHDPDSVTQLALRN